MIDWLYFKVAHTSHAEQAQKSHVPYNVPYVCDVCADTCAWLSVNRKVQTIFCRMRPTAVRWDIRSALWLNLKIQKFSIFTNTISNFKSSHRALRKSDLSVIELIRQEIVCTLTLKHMAHIHAHTWYRWRETTGENISLTGETTEGKNINPAVETTAEKYITSPIIHVIMSHWEFTRGPKFRL